MAVGHFPTDRSGGRRWAVLTGLTLGLNILSRPSSIGLVGSCFSACGCEPGGTEKKGRKAAPGIGGARPIMVVATMSLTVAPWLARDLLVHHRPVWISTNGGFTFWNGNNPFTTGSAFDVRTADLAAYSGEIVSAPDGAPIVQVKPYPLPLELRDTVATLDEVALDRALYSASVAFIQGHPGRWLGLLAQKVVSLWWFRPTLAIQRLL